MYESRDNLLKSKKNVMFWIPSFARLFDWVHDCSEINEQIFMDFLLGVGDRPKEEVIKF